MKRESLKKELQPYYEKSDCCPWIVELRKKVWDKNKEIKRLNNIINELEKEFEEVFSRMKEKQVEIDGRGYYYTDLIPIEDILEDIKELKGSDK